MNSAPATAVNVFVTNALPYFCDHTDGLWRRFRVIKFSEVMAGRNTENTNLREELVQELPGIYNWALHGAAMLDPGKPFPGTEEGQHILTEHRENCNPLLPLIRKLFREEEGEAISRKDAYRRFRDSAEALMRNPPTKPQFTEALKKEFPEVQPTVMYGPYGKEEVWLNINFQVRGFAEVDTVENVSITAEEVPATDEKEVGQDDLEWGSQPTLGF